MDDKQKELRFLIQNYNFPLVFRNFLKDCKLCEYSLEDWSRSLGNQQIPFRSFKRSIASEDPCWERLCDKVNITFDEFVKSTENNNGTWMYFDYKYLHEWLKQDGEVAKYLPWSQFGFPEVGFTDTTLWVGSEGAHTPAHQDTYGINLVAQVYGRKRWVLFPPETGGLKHTRVPYEESSVYSELNFYCPNNLDNFKGLNRCHIVEVSAGDVLLVPKGWWHYVQNMEPVNISMNAWLPHEEDGSTRVSEALIKIFVAQICKDMPEETAKLLVNPNEDDILETPLAVMFLQLETVAKEYLDKRRKNRRAKRQRTREDDPQDVEDNNYDIQQIIDNKDYHIHLPQISNSEKLLDMLKDNVQKYCETESSQDDVDGSTSSLCLTKAVIDAFTDNSVIEVAKQNLFNRLSGYM